MSKYLLLMIFISPSCFSESLELCTTEAIDQYKVAVHDEVSSKIEYPEIAVRRGWKGVGMINFLIIDSVVFTKEITQSTGYQILDSAIEDAINKSTFPKLTCQTMNKNISIAVPISFQLPLSRPTYHSSGTPDGAP